MKKNGIRLLAALMTVSIILSGYGMQKVSASSTSQNVNISNKQQQSSDVNNNKIIAFITDFGLKEGSVGEMKGVALGVDPDLKLFDITHEIPAYDIWNGCYRLEQSCKYWPKGTIFVCVVDPGVGTERKAIAIKTFNGYTFLGPDNGLFTLIAENMGIKEIREIDLKKNLRPDNEAKDSHTFHGRDLFGYTAARLAADKIQFEDIGPIQKEIVKIPYQKPGIKNGAAIGMLPVIDANYGNVWTNIDKQTFEKLGAKVGKMINVEIMHKNKVVYRGKIKFCNTFGDVPEGQNLLYYNELLNVSLAVNMGDFSTKYKIGAGEEWTAKFTLVK
jgi:S-adenosylmethionine hydrolase